MNLKSAKVITTILLVVAIIAFVFGIGTAIKADKARAHNPEKIQIELLEIRPDVSDSYYVYMNYSIKNKTGKELDSVSVYADVKDKSGKALGTIKLAFGGTGSNALHLKKGSVEKEIYLESRTPDEFFATLFQANAGDLQITYEVYSAQWTDGYLFFNL